MKLSKVIILNIVLVFILAVVIADQVGVVTFDQNMTIEQGLIFTFGGVLFGCVIYLIK